ncbi:uncharacterized protein I206_106483 [Kwoniella pini CBS 10737]|uniref:Uncharacterized protein n=1 Tax=Kwoniella pini CBS 10737 TaxID=1296096 RepID=A0A1B9HUF5_9TREE|nr:uncharacterized protein I206_07288 [Kwoniella pini CBS 10737]OCF46901.1 hypothetical protein I206_07288 [Kwoniella pini CBS 10737]
MSMLPPPVPASRNRSSSSESPSTSSTSTKGDVIDENRIEDTFKEFEDYKFTEDVAFNAGLPTVFSAIRGKKMSPALIDKTIAEAQWFYFTTRIKKNPLPFSVYTQYVDKQTSSNIPLRFDTPDTPSTKESKPEIEHPDSNARMEHLTEAMRMMGTLGNEAETDLTFDKLVQLIQEGRVEELRGKDIPDELNTSPPSKSTLEARPKPWQQNMRSSDSSLLAASPSNGSIFSSLSHGTLPRGSLLSSSNLPNQTITLLAQTPLDSQSQTDIPLTDEQLDELIGACISRTGEPTIPILLSPIQAAQIQDRMLAQDLEMTNYIKQCQQNIQAQNLDGVNTGLAPGNSVQSPFTPEFDYINWSGEDITLPSQDPSSSTISNPSRKAGQPSIDMDVDEVERESRITP